MRGVVLNPLGGDLAPAFNISPAANVYFRVSAQQFGFWFWRVKDIRFHGAVTVDGVTQTEDFTIARGATDGITGIPVDHEFQLEEPGRTSGYGWVDITGGGGRSIINFQAGAVYRDIAEPDIEQAWLMSISGSFTGANLNTGVTANATGASLVLSATDPVLSHVYSSTVTLYSSAPVVATGDYTIEPASFWPWFDEDGAPLYDTATGGYAA